MLGKRKKTAEAAAPAPTPVQPAPVMKKYVFEAEKTQWEKPTEGKYVFCAPARVSVFAESEDQAKKLAGQKLKAEYAGTGVILGEAALVESFSQPVDWSYGYDDARRTGRTDSIGDLVGKNVIR